MSGVGRVQVGPVDEQTLRGLLARGVFHPLIDLKLAYAEKAQLLNHYIGPAAGRPNKDPKKKPWLTGDSRAFPSMLPTQASGRWSISEPPIATFPPDDRSIIIPDHGWVFAIWDYDAIEARIVACETHDTQDLQAFEKGWDLHTLTASDIFRFPKPQDYRDPHTSVVDALWREKLQWGGKDDRRRHMSKTARYALYYARDHKGILSIKDAEALAEKWGQDPLTFRTTLLKIGRDYLQSKPNLVARKKQAWERAWTTHQAVTSLGRVRPLMGGKHDVQKEGWNHEIQGTVADIMNRALKEIDARWPEDAVLAYQSHDSGTFAFPVEVEWWPQIKSYTDQTHVIAGHKMLFTTTWKVIPPGGHRCNRLCKPAKCHDWSPEEWFQGGERERYLGR